jgi:site-specific DNA recombinase
MAPSYRNFPTDLDVIVYSRKSREDLEAEERARRAGDLNFDVLARHRKRLLEAARAHRWNILAFFEEVVSGELLDERPEIQKVLDWVENRGIDGVLTIDIDRFGRGDSD